MYLLGILLLVPIILTTGKEVQINNYVIQFSNEDPTIVKSIRVSGDLSKVLDLSRLGITDFKDNAFENVGHIKKLIVSYNSISELQHTSFGNLPNLEYLDLSYNNITTMKKPFAHLSNLNNLDLTKNQILNLTASNFFGLTESCLISLKDNNISFMSSELFENKSYPIHSIENQRYKREVSLPTFLPRIEVCIVETKLISVEPYTVGKKLASGCTTRYHADGVLRLNTSCIATLQEGWYKLGNLPMHYIDLSSSDITHLTREMFNDLPENVRSVNLVNNHIVRLEKDIIVNEHLREMNFYDNFMNEIEANVFINTKLTILKLGRNRLRSTKFVATLPSTLTKLDLYSNGISKIYPESFSKLKKLKTLMLKNNYIRVIYRASFRGLTGLEKLHLSENKMQSIEVGSFEDLKNLRYIDLDHNNFISLDLSLFAGLNLLKSIFANYNKLRQVMGDTSIGFSHTCIDLFLENNEFRILKPSTFPYNFPICSLFLNNNSIVNIENGTFNKPNLRFIQMQHNFLDLVDNGMFQGSKSLSQLDLSRNSITRIEKGAFENSGNLCILVLSGNPIEELENGALYGLEKSENCGVFIQDVPIEEIRGGVFDKSR